MVAIILGLFLGIACQMIGMPQKVKAQGDTSTTLPLKTTLSSNKRWPDPNKAAKLSLIFPGLGQVYNKRYWKIPIVYAALGTCVFFTLQNHHQYITFRNAYRMRTDNDPLTVDSFVFQYPNPQTLLVFRDFYRRNRDLSIIACALTYVLSAIEAYVDAHLRYFDVSENLGFYFSPLSLQARLAYQF
ncbi:MAG: DUF5683 domain-containing protein [Bacteroidia bacterium]|nr:DUF5683 domain-containing protein [Bacteroidia bacterium]MDW8158602.1 DUF5683 domain-containing protein [Bacteroidia bacterium]